MAFDGYYPAKEATHCLISGFFALHSRGMIRLKAISLFFMEAIGNLNKVFSAAEI